MATTEGSSAFSPTRATLDIAMEPEVMVWIMLGITGFLAIFAIIVMCCCCWDKPAQSAARRQRQQQQKQQERQGTLRQDDVQLKGVVVDPPLEDDRFKRLSNPTTAKKNTYQDVKKAKPANKKPANRGRKKPAPLPRTIGNKRLSQRYENWGFEVPVEADPDPERRQYRGAAEVPDEPLHYDAMPLVERILKNVLEDSFLDSENLQLGDIIGRGHFGLVYHGKLTQNQQVVDVAVKTVHGEDCGEDELSDFIGEVVRMRGFSHVHVISMLGVAMRNKKPYVILPYMHFGDLREYLQNIDRNFNIEHLLHIGLQVAEGMEYLALKKFVHRDLAARNCMVDQDGVVKVADFGLSRDMHDDDYYRMTNMSTPLPIRWVAIECVSEKKFSEKSDVWSYGVLLWEVMTRGVKPYPEVGRNEKVVAFIRGGRRMMKPQHAPDQVYQVMLNCWKLDPADRPTFSEIIVTMNDFLYDDSGYEKPRNKSKSACVIS